MEKKIVAFSKIEYEKVMYNGEEILVHPYISQVEQIQIINKYIQTYFNRDQFSLIEMTEYDLFNAEMEFAMMIVGMKTNIDTSFNFDDFMASGVYNQITKKITNFWNLRDMIDAIVTEIKEQIKLRLSMGKIVDGLVKDITIFLNNVSDGLENVDAEKLRKVGKELLDEMKSSSISEVFKESSK